MANAKGRPGYTYANVSLKTNFLYSGGGVAGMGALGSGGSGTTFDGTFAVRERNKELIRPRQDTTDSAYQTGVGGPIGLRIKLMGYFKGQNLPDSSFQNEFIYVNAQVCLGFIGIILVERFVEVGVIDNAIHYELEGTTDGPFTNTDIAGA